MVSQVNLSAMCNTANKHCTLCSAKCLNTSLLPRIFYLFANILDYSFFASRLSFTFTTFKIILNLADKAPGCVCLFK